MSSFSNGIKSNENQYELRINLEKMNYFPGEIINASIQIISKDNINLNYNSLRISYFVKNVEYWQNNMNIKESNEQTPGGNYINEKEGILNDKNNYFENIILSKEEIISNINKPFNLVNNFRNNEISIIIKIQLPKEMKPSFEWYKNNNTYCFARTILSIHIPDLKLYSYNYLFIKKPQPNSINSINIQKTLGKEAFIFFWEKDNIKFDISSKKNCFAFNDIFPIQINVDTSQLKSELISINLTFKRKIKFMINGEQSVFLNTSDYTEDLWEEKVTLDKKESTHNLKFEIPISDKERTIIKKKINFNMDFKLYNKKILTYLMPSYTGSNIKCEYFLKIKCIFARNNINVNEFMVNFELFHENNSFNEEAINDIDSIFNEINNKIMNENNSNNKFNNYINSGYNFSVPDEEMLKRYYSNKSSKTMNPYDT